MTTTTHAESPRRRSLVRGRWVEEVEEGGCPECGHLRYVVTDGQPANRTDPGWWEGRCACAEKQAEACDGNCMDEECCGC